MYFHFQMPDEIILKQLNRFNEKLMEIGFSHDLS